MNTVEVFPYVIEIATNANDGITLKAQKKWLVDNGYVEREDFRHCGTKKKFIADIETNISFSWGSQQFKFNRFRFKKEEDAIHFKIAWQ